MSRYEPIRTENEPIILSDFWMIFSQQVTFCSSDVLKRYVHFFEKSGHIAEMCPDFYGNQ